MTHIARFQSGNTHTFGARNTFTCDEDDLTLQGRERCIIATCLFGVGDGELLLNLVDRIPVLFYGRLDPLEPLPHSRKTPVKFSDVDLFVLHVLFVLEDAILKASCIRSHRPGDERQHPE